MTDAIRPYFKEPKRSIASAGMPLVVTTATPKARLVPAEPAAVANTLLASLPDADWRRWSPVLEVVEMPLGQVLHEANTAPNYVVFPTSAIVSLLSVLQRGASAEIAAVGREGIVGVASIMGGNSMAVRAIVRSAGRGLRMRTALLKAEFARSPAVMHLLLRYTHALATQLAQSAACYRHHTLNRQLSRWLLMSLDRLDGHTLRMTHGQIADALGVRREAVTAEALKLQKAGLIRYSRGQISVIDRGGLEMRACECYGVVRKEYDRLLPPKESARRTR